MKSNCTTLFYDKHAIRRKMANNESMSANESQQLDERSNEIASCNLTKLQNIIKNKCEKVRNDRLEHERDVHRIIQPTLTPSNESTTIENMIDASGINDLNPNELCDELKSLINESIRNKDKKIHITEIKSIIAKLYNLDMLV